MRPIHGAAALTLALAGLAACASATPPPPETNVTLSDPLGRGVEVIGKGDWQASPPALHLYLYDAAGSEVARIPDFPTDYGFYELRDLAEADVDGDGDGDLVAIADYVTGIGPDGAEPFSQAAVWLREADGFTPAPDLVADVNAAGEIDGMDTLLAALARGTAQP
ncbi:MAG: hypothetical protein KDA73_03515 [Rhodobacteraceae bacterium]|nr:hypothetical protein [Paracoccaceae bacterium]